MRYDCHFLQTNCLSKLMIIGTQMYSDSLNRKKIKINKSAPIHCDQHSGKKKKNLIFLYISVSN